MTSYLLQPLKLGLARILSAYLADFVHGVDLGGSGVFHDLTLHNVELRVDTLAGLLLPPNSRFKVVSHFDAGNGLTIIQLKELPPKDPIIDFRRSALSSCSCPRPRPFPRSCLLCLPLLPRPRP